MGDDQGDAKMLSLDNRPLRDLGGSYGFTLDKEALKKADFIDEDGELKDDFSTRIIQYDDGTVRAKIDD